MSEIKGLPCVGKRQRAVCVFGRVGGEFCPG